MDKKTMPYFPISSGEYKAFRTKLTDAELIKVLDKISDVAVFGTSNIVFETEFQELFYDKLKTLYDKNLKSYNASVENGKKGGRPRRDLSGEVKITEVPVMLPQKPIAYDITCNPLIDKVFKIYEDNCKDLKPIRYEKRNRETLEMVAKFLMETSNDFEYFKEVCVKANQQKVICDNALDFKSVIKNHISISNEKFKKGSSGELMSKLKFK